MVKRPELDDRQPGPRSILDLNRSGGTTFACEVVARAHSRLDDRQTRRRAPGARPPGLGSPARRRERADRGEPRPARAPRATPAPQGSPTAGAKRRCSLSSPTPAFGPARRSRSSGTTSGRKPSWSSGHCLSATRRTPRRRRTAPSGFSRHCVPILRSGGLRPAGRGGTSPCSPTIAAVRGARRHISHGVGGGSTTRVPRRASTRPRRTPSATASPACSFTRAAASSTSLASSDTTPA